MKPTVKENSFLWDQGQDHSSRFKRNWATGSKSLISKITLNVTSMIWSYFIKFSMQCAVLISVCTNINLSI